jgi:DNA-binding transcriptional LysR family regulator
VPTLRQLEYLVAVADIRHFGRAAERVHVTQPTLSEQLKTLEQRLGVQLVERSRSNVVVTPLGFEVVEIARRMLRDAQRIQDVTGYAGSAMSGVVRLGLPSCCRAWRPNSTPSIRSSSSMFGRSCRMCFPANWLKDVTTSSWLRYRSPRTA